MDRASILVYGMRRLGKVGYPTGYRPIWRFRQSMTEALAERGRQLQAHGLTPLRAFRVLKHEFPNAERDHLWKAAGEQFGLDWPMWAYHGSAPAEARFRNDPRKESALCTTNRKKEATSWT